MQWLCFYFSPLSLSLPHRSSLFLSLFSDKHFLVFFFTRLRRNESGRYQDDFPFLSLCGRERNFLRCDDRPLVFTHLMPAAGGIVNQPISQSIHQSINHILFIKPFYIICHEVLLHYPC